MFYYVIWFSVFHANVYLSSHRTLLPLLLGVSTAKMLKKACSDKCGPATFQNQSHHSPTENLWTHTTQTKYKV